MGDMGNAERNLVGKSELKKSLGRISCRQINNIKMNLEKIMFGWIKMAQVIDQWRDSLNIIMKPSLCYRRNFSWNL
jgi:hypothetical protein